MQIQAAHPAHRESQAVPLPVPSCLASYCPFHTLESLSQTRDSITVPRCAPTRNLLAYILSNKVNGQPCMQPTAQSCTWTLSTSSFCPEFLTSAYSPSACPASVNSSGSSQHLSVLGSRVSQEHLAFHALGGRCQNKCILCPQPLDRKGLAWTKGGLQQQLT